MTGTNGISHFHLYIVLLYYSLTIQLLLLILSTVYSCGVSLPWLFGACLRIQWFVGHVWVKCTTILTNNAMMEEP